MDEEKQKSMASFADALTSLSPFEFTTLGVIAGYILSYGLSVNQLNAIGNWFELIGQLMLTIGAQKTLKSPGVSYQEFQELKTSVSNILKMISKNNYK